MQDFTGFLPQTIDFFWELRMNNNKEWMDQNRERYKTVLKDPFDSFAKTVEKEFCKISGENLISSVSRINRDVRYSKDKSPYRACRWMVLKEPLTQGTGWKNRPTFYFELSPEGYVYGMGFYEATPIYMQQFRKKIDSDPAGFERIVGDLQKGKKYSLNGDDYKKVKAEHLTETVRPFYTKKSFAVAASKELEDVIFTEKLPQLIAKEWKKLLPLYGYLKNIVQE